MYSENSRVRQSASIHSTPVTASMREVSPCVVCLSQKMMCPM
jgi:hypothetical protein